MPLRQVRNKSEILAAAIVARARGASWQGALQAAKKAGYRGSVEDIQKLVRTFNPKAGRRDILRPSKRIFYDAQVKARFLSAALDAKRLGGKLRDMYNAARNEGYRGSKAGIGSMLKLEHDFLVQQPEEDEMPVAKRYDKKTKDAILSAAVSTRKAGKTWAEAFSAAKDAGYNGSQQGLEQMMRNASKKAARGGAKTTKAAKPGKPKGKRRGRPPMKVGAAAPEGNGVASINEVVEQVVRQRVRAVLDKAIAELQRAL